MKVLLDTNVVLDILLNREPFVDDAAMIVSKIERGELTGFLCATTITTIHYLATKSIGSQKAEKHIQTLLALFEIAPVNRIVLENALKGKWKDYEDSVLQESAVHSGVEYIITRDVSGFKNSKLPVYSPDEFLTILETITH
ncbi:MAG: PIN domain-containing protein [Nitrospinae bacterium]|nr:PIN domain-containing protein [Nitrospinota bacterium]